MNSYPCALFQHTLDNWMVWVELYWLCAPIYSLHVYVLNWVTRIEDESLFAMWMHNWIHENARECAHLRYSLRCGSGFIVRWREHSGITFTANVTKTLFYTIKCGNIIWIVDKTTSGINSFMLLGNSTQSIFFLDQVTCVILIFWVLHKILQTLTY